MMPSVRTSAFAITALLALAAICPAALAHHEGPERVVDDTYVVLLLLQPQEGNAMRLTFTVRDMHTGKQLTTPMTGIVEFIEADTKKAAMEPQRIAGEGGRATMTTTFPHDGLYNIGLSFRLGNPPGELYQPEAWDVWMPGTEKRSLPFGTSEWLTVGLGAFFAVLVGMSLLQNSRKKSTI